ncbi:hypothetical protein RR46_01123 [Papilio xuthus]|uniref:Uncharacterized protein n=1 Tax=Papilio xuthus TaxID=66420 RepID=A0A0N1ICF3_PAPXU|nr:hypothetical protein RR46_01123 [Papilio xuthus]
MATVCETIQETITQHSCKPNCKCKQETCPPDCSCKIESSRARIYRLSFNIKMNHICNI